MRQVGPCPKCGGSMTAGFIVDEGYGSAQTSSWHPGPVVRSIWTGVKAKKANRLPITSWRCQRCGFLENYAVQGQV